MERESEKEKGTWRERWRKCLEEERERVLGEREVWTEKTRTEGLRGREKKWRGKRWRREGGEWGGSGARERERDRERG